MDLILQAEDVFCMNKIYSYIIQHAPPLKSIRTKNLHHKNSFFPSAAALINKAQDPTDMDS